METMLRMLAEGLIPLRIINEMFDPNFDVSGYADWFDTFGEKGLSAVEDETGQRLLAITARRTIKEIRDVSFFFYLVHFVLFAYSSVSFVGEGLVAINGGCDHIVGGYSEHFARPR